MGEANPKCWRSLAWPPVIGMPMSSLEHQNGYRRLGEHNPRPTPNVYPCYAHLNPSNPLCSGTSPFRVSLPPVPATTRRHLYAASITNWASRVSGSYHLDHLIRIK